MAGVEAIDVLELRNVGAVVGRVERGEELLHHLAAAVLECAQEARDVLVAEREIVRDRDRALELQLLRGVVAHRMARLRRGGARAHQPRVRLALGHVLGARDGEDRRLGGADVVVDRQRLEGGERADQHIHVEALDQLLGLGARLRRVAAGVGGLQLDRTAGEHVVAFLEERHHALFHLQPARGERAGLDGEKADLDRPGLRDRGRDFQRGRRDATRERAFQDGAAIEAHAVSSQVCLLS